jgi:hypothetical protein
MRDPLKEATDMIGARLTDTDKEKEGGKVVPMKRGT